MRREYTAEQRVAAIGLAMTLGPVRAGKQLGIPTRTVTNWTHSSEAVVLRIGTQELLELRLREAVAVGVDEVLKGLRDPKARLGDKARALEVVAQQHALLTGGVTERTESMQSHDWEPITTPEIRAELADMMAIIENATDEEIVEHEQKAMRMLDVAQKALFAGSDATERAGLRDSIDVLNEPEGGDP